VTLTDQTRLMPLVQRWRRYATLSADDCRAIVALPFTERRFGRDTYVVREGDAVSHCCLLLDGFAYRQKLLRNGSRQIISIHIPTEFVDLQNSMLSIADHNVQSLNQCDVAQIPREAILDLMETRPAIRLALWTDTLIDASIFREWVVNVGRRDSRARIAHLICELSVRLKWIGKGDDVTCEFPLTQEHIADCTGLTPVHTNRTLQRLRRDGLIQLSARSLTILDWEGLREAGDFEELYLHPSENFAEANRA
jgi:CRP-like cAMP-binding protein